MQHRHRKPKGRWALTVLLSIAVVGCDEFGPRVYTAQPFQPDLGCLDAYVPIGLVRAQEVGAECEPVCLRLGESLYVSTVCPPYPTEVNIEPPDAAECAAALTALADETSCEDGGDAGAELPEAP